MGERLGPEDLPKAGSGPQESQDSVGLSGLPEGGLPRTLGSERESVPPADPAGVGRDLAESLTGGRRTGATPPGRGRGSRSPTRIGTGPGAARGPGRTGPPSRPPGLAETAGMPTWGPDRVPGRDAQGSHTEPLPRVAAGSRSRYHRTKVADSPMFPSARARFLPPESPTGADRRMGLDGPVPHRRLHREPAGVVRPVPIR